MNQIIKDLEHIEKKVEGWKTEINDGLALSKEVNTDLDTLSTKINEFKNQNNIETKTDKPADGVDVEALQAELAELKKTVEKYDEIIKKIKNHVNDIGDKPKEWHEEIKKKVLRNFSLRGNKWFVNNYDRK